MADELPTQSFQLKDLPTKSVTLYPARAHVIRELNGLVLQPGQNTIEILGLTSFADESSVQIDGKGAATITDMTLELLPNPERFEDAHPIDTEEETSDDSDYEDSDDEIEEVGKWSKMIKDTEAGIEAAIESQKSAAQRLKALDNYSHGLKSDKEVKISPSEAAEGLAMYDRERQQLFRADAEAKTELKKLNKQKARYEAEKAKAGKEEAKQKAKARKEKEKQLEKTRRQREEKRRQAERARDEKRKFWPHSYYKITLGLETSYDTPSPSRRGSMDSVTLSGVPSADTKGKGAASVASPERSVSLSLSYVTNSAFWSPRYDISINSQQKTATIVYRAEFSNGTSETWKDAKVILSTSQTSYTGLDDKAPYMQAWQIRLGRAWENNSGGLLSSAELKGPRYQNAVISQRSKENYKMKKSAAPQIPFQQSSYQSMPQSFGSVQPTMQPQSNAMPRGGASLFASSAAPAASALFGSAPPPPPAPGGAPQIQSVGEQNVQLDKAVSKARRVSRLGGGLFGGGGGGDRDRKREEDRASSVSIAEVQEVMAEAESEEDEMGDGLDFEESVWEDNGLTANYELPGIRTLAPSSLARRHKIAALNATNILLSHICVPKLRSAAFLRAKIRNPSTSVTLLKGTAGVTLDGSFLGNMSLPRVSPSQMFTLPLGVDPGIQISYPKPNVHRSTSGFISKEHAHTFSRSIWLTNTKSTSVDLLVLDQVPISQDERLRVDILQPRGLSKEGDAVRAGQAAKEGGKEIAPTGSVKEGAWGKATASLKKNGEINWTVALEKSAACLLKLEYEARMPSGETIVEV